MTSGGRAFCAGNGGNADIFYFMKLAMGHIQDIGSIWTGHTCHSEMRTSNLSENILADGLWAFEAKYSVDGWWLAFVPRNGRWQIIATETKLF